MAIVTIDGYRGSGSTEVGIRVAEALNANYIDRLLLRRAAEKAQAPIGEFVGRAGREHYPPRGIIERMQRFLERWVDAYSRNSVYVNPWEGFAFLGHSKEIDEELAKIARIPPKFVDDHRFIRSIGDALEEMAMADNLVVVGRGGCSILKHFPNALHIGLAAPFGTRVIRNMRKHNFTAVEAAKFTKDTDEARQRFYRKFFDTNPDNPSLYSLSLNTQSLHPELATELIVTRAEMLANNRQN
jgi:cytidylate kinase